MESSFCYDPTESAASCKQINHDVLYREGKTITGTPTYTPRLIALDLKGSLNTLSAEGTLYDVHAQEEDVKWEGDVTLHKVTPPYKNEFLADLDLQDGLYAQGSASQNEEEDRSSQDTDTMETKDEKAATEKASKASKLYHLDDSVVVWSDYLYGHLHPKSVSVIKDYSHESDVEPFELFTKGKSLMHRPDIEDDIEDRLHFFVEECDHLQGFQVLVDFYNGFGGVSCSLVESLCDEYGGKGILAVGLAPTVYSRETPAADSHRVINSVLAIEKLAKQCSIFLPVSASKTLWRKPGPPVTFPHLSYDSSLHYHTSAILASSLETMMLPYRTIDNPTSLAVLSDGLTTMGRKICTLQSSLPFPFPAGSCLANVINKFDGQAPWTPLTPYAHNTTATPFSQSVLLRGIPKDMLNIAGRHPTNQIEMCKTGSEMLSQYLRNLYPQTHSSALCVNQISKTTAPYPHIFKENVNPEGYMNDAGRQYDQGVNGVPMMTSLQSSPSTHTLITELVRQAERLDIRKFHGYFEDGTLEPDEFKETFEVLKGLAECYQV